MQAADSSSGGAGGGGGGGGLLPSTSYASSNQQQQQHHHHLGASGMKARRSSSSNMTTASTSASRAAHLQFRTLIPWVHDPPNFSTSDVVLNPEYDLGGGVGENDLLELRLRDPSRAKFPEPFSGGVGGGRGAGAGQDDDRQGGLAGKKRKRSHPKAFLFRLNHAVADTDAIVKHPQLQISVSRSVANAFGFQSRVEVVLSRVRVVSLHAPHFA